MKIFLIILITILAISFLMSKLRSRDISHYKDKEPKLDIREYFNGKLNGFGVIKDIRGKVSSQFTFSMSGEWKSESEGTLIEDFVFASGKTQHREWQVKMLDNNNFEATASDAVGKAIGTQLGNAVNMRYVLDIPREDSSIKLKFDDWLFRIDENKVINTAYMYKFGIKVGEIVISFEKQ